jgi:hypothetical protein
VSYNSFSSDVVSRSQELNCASFLANINLRTFFLQHSLTLDSKTFASQLVTLYPELKWLTKKVEISPEDAAAIAHEDAFSTMLFGELHPEIERTMTSLVILQQILKGDYEGLVRAQGTNPVKLKPASFDYIRQVFFKVIGNEDWNGPIPTGSEAINAVSIEKLDALITYMAIHDLGKSKSFKNVAQKVSAKLSVDHDRVLIHGLNEEEMLSTSFERLPTKYKRMILAGMEADFNMGQFAQAENVAASLNKLAGLEKDSFDFYFVHFFLDVAGSSGVKDPTGSKMMIEPVFGGFRAGYEFLPHLYEGMNSDQLYKYFLQQRAATLMLPFENDRDYAIARLALLSRAPNPQEAAKVKFAFERLPQNIQSLLTRELNITGNGNELAILPYYAPAVIANYRTALRKAGGTDPHVLHGIDVLALEDSYKFIAEAMLLARTQIKSEKGPGIYTLGLNDMATLATKDPASLKTAKFKMDKTHGDGADLKIEAASNRNLENLPKAEDKFFQKLPNHLIVVALGGGSDVVQGELIARMLAQHGKKTEALISVQNIVSSNPKAGETPKVRKITDETEKLSPTLMKIGPHTKMVNTSRFLEPAVAEHSQIPIYLSLRENPEQLSKDLALALERAHLKIPKGEKVSIIVVDTGGDLLHPIVRAEDKDLSITPDQDQEVFKHILDLSQRDNIPMTAMIAAPGIDSPRNFPEILEQSQALRWDLTSTEKDLVQSGYKEMKLDGSDPKRFSKTAPMWSQALRQGAGKMVLPLPDTLVTHPTNPWNPFVHIEDSHASIVISDAKALWEILNRP